MHTPISVSEKAVPPMVEIASTRDGRDITRAYVGAVQPPADPLLQRRAADHALYDEVLRDDQVYSCLQQRRSVLLARQFEIVPGGSDKQSQMAADLLRATMNHLPMADILDRMHYGLFYGYAVAEALWVQDGTHLTIDALKVRRARRFRFGADGALRLLTRTQPMDGEALPERKFWCFAAPSDNDDAPDGVGLAYWCYWPVYFKRNGLKFWMIYLEKFGMPTALGTYDLSASGDDQRRLLDAVQAVQTDSGIIVPDGMKIELIEAGRSGHADYEALSARMDRAIAKVILSQTMTTEDGSSRAQGEVHERMLTRLAAQDGARLADSFTAGPARWLTEVNYPDAIPPRVICAPKVEGAETE